MPQFQLSTIIGVCVAVFGALHTAFPANPVYAFLAAGAAAIVLDESGKSS